MLERLRQLQQVPQHHVVARLPETHNGELSDVFIRIGVVEKLQGSLDRQHRPAGQQGVQFQDGVLGRDSIGH